MKYLLDTDAFSEIAKELNPRVSARLNAVPGGEVGTSVITLGEVKFGVLANPGTMPPRLAARIDALAATLPILPLDVYAAERYAELRAHLRRLGTPIGPNDLWIAAHALALDLTLVTGNEREYSRVPTLRVENWMR